MHNRYSRQILLNEIGIEGQVMLQKKKVAIVGIGALGTVAAELLARAGVGSLLLIDRDVVEESNLQRQTLFEEQDIGKSKAAAAEEKLTRINSHIVVSHKTTYLNPENVQIIQDVDLILDCTDNLQTRLLINDYCRKEKKTWIYAAAIKTSGYVMPIFSAGPCLQCFVSETNLETCNTVGVLNTITVSIASLQATLALKILLGKEVETSLHYYDIWNQNFKKLKVKNNTGCFTCSGNYIHLEKKETAKIIRFCSAGKYQIEGPKVDLEEIKKRWEKIDKVGQDSEVLQFKKIMLFKDGRVLISTESMEEAQSIYSKWVGN